ncbi:hypothetical protein TNCV_245271 [Trichonephila clavipes]|nr:hypothetical protein TNCV_245271 [Trichonephila clavipes]
MVSHTMVKGRGRHLNWYPLLLTSTPHQREDVPASTDLTCVAPSARRVFSDSRLELLTRQPRVRYLDHLATTATRYFQTIWEALAFRIFKPHL